MYVKRLFCVALSLWCSAVSADLALSATRVVLTEAKPEQTLMLSNTYDYPVLLQVWMSDGDPKGTPDTDTAPIIATPPIFRLDPGMTRSVRLIHDGSSLPKHKESVYWINLHEVPALALVDMKKSMERVQVATRTQLKVFYRPKAVVESLEQVASGLRFRLERNGDREWVVYCENPASRYATLSSLFLSNEEGYLVQAKAQMGAMVAPGEELTFWFPVKKQQDTETWMLYYTLIGDDGRPVQFSAPLAGT